MRSCVHAARRRGSAMTELLICLFPYMVLLGGTVLLGQLALGKQEAVKALAWSSGNPHVAAGDALDASTRVCWFGARGGAGAGPSLEKSTADPTVDPATEEPVPTYEMGDIKAAISRYSTTPKVQMIVGTNGEATFTFSMSATAAGAELAAVEFFGMDASSSLALTADQYRAGGIHASGPNISITGLSGDELSGITVNFPIDEALCAEVANALKPWVSNAEVSAGFSYSLDVGGTDTGLAPSTEADPLRQPFTIGAQALPPLYSTAPDENRGAHVDATVKLDEISAVPFESEDSGSPVVDPTAAGIPGGYASPATSIQGAWDKNYDPASATE